MTLSLVTSLTKVSFGKNMSHRRLKFCIWVCFFTLIVKNLTRSDNITYVRSRYFLVVLPISAGSGLDNTKKIGGLPIIRDYLLVN